MFSKVTSALIDLSGTLHIEDTIIPGAAFALQRLRAAGIKVKFVTNTTKEPLRMLHDKLIHLGFDIHREEIFTSLTAARNVVSAMQLRPFLMLEDCAKEDFEGISESDPNAVVIGLAPTQFNYAAMNQAFGLLLDGAPLIAIHKGRYYRKQDGLYLGPGPFVTGLEFAANVTAQVVGKPERQFFLEAIKSLDTDVNSTVMIGDDVRDDVAGAMNAGLRGILVKTGKYRDGDEATINPAPTAVCADFAAAVELVLNDRCQTL